MLFSSSKRARNSTKNQQLLYRFQQLQSNDLIILDFFATRYKVILILATFVSRLASSNKRRNGDIDSYGYDNKISFLKICLIIGTVFSTKGLFLASNFFIEHFWVNVA